MSDYRHGSHTTFSIHLHIVWITKYRHKVLRGEVAERVRAIVREECQKARVDILKGHISSDHVHVMVAIPPHVTDEVIKAYIAQQSRASDDVFRIEGEASPSGDTPLETPRERGLPLDCSPLERVEKRLQPQHTT